jgi:lipid-binding SYLF domain-containing protein
MKLMMAMTIVTTLALTPLLAADNEPAKRLDDAAAVFSEIMRSPDKGIPQDLLQNAHCIVIVPDLKTAAFGVGGKYGKGYLSCRNKNGAGWSAPATVRIEGGSVGFQIGASSTDLMREDLDDNATLYGKKLANSEIVTKGVRPPKAAAKLLDLLNRYSAKERKNWSHVAA